MTEVKKLVQQVADELDQIEGQVNQINQEIQQLRQEIANREEQIKQLGSRYANRTGRINVLQELHPDVVKEVIDERLAAAPNAPVEPAKEEVKTEKASEPADTDAGEAKPAE